MWFFYGGGVFDVQNPSENFLPFCMFISINIIFFPKEYYHV